MYYIRDLIILYTRTDFCWIWRSGHVWWSNNDCFTHWS